MEVKKVTEEDESYAKTTVGNNSQSKAKSINVLGSTWNVENDEFHSQLGEIITLAKSLLFTKRSFLRVSSKIFDLLGILRPFTIVLKVAFESICVEGLDWDEELQNPSRKLWNSFLSDITQLERIRVPRCYFNTSTNPTNKQLHSFSDALKKAFAAVTYLQSTYPDGHVETRLVAAKTRVAPIETQAIPRLELLVAVISARLLNTITRIFLTTSKSNLCTGPILQRLSNGYIMINIGGSMCNNAFKRFGNSQRTMETLSR